MNLYLIHCSLLSLHICLFESLSSDLASLASDFADSDSCLSANAHSPTRPSFNILTIVERQEYNSDLYLIESFKQKILKKDEWVNVRWLKD